MDGYRVCARLSFFSLRPQHPSHPVLRAGFHLFPPRQLVQSPKTILCSSCRPSCKGGSSSSNCALLRIHPQSREFTRLTDDALFDSQSEPYMLCDTQDCSWGVQAQRSHRPGRPKLNGTFVSLWTVLILVKGRCVLRHRQSCEHVSASRPSHPRANVWPSFVRLTSVPFLRIVAAVLIRRTALSRSTGDAGRVSTRRSCGPIYTETVLLERSSSRVATERAETGRDGAPFLIFSLL